MLKTGIFNLQTYVQKNQANIIVLADKHTMDYCYPLLLEEVSYFIVPYGEGYKNLDSCEFIWKKLTEFGATRETILLCLGGGVVCDMGGFCCRLFSARYKNGTCSYYLVGNGRCIDRGQKWSQFYGL